MIQKINPKRLTAMRRKMKKLAPKLTEKAVSYTHLDVYKRQLRERAYIMISFGLVNQEAQAKATVDNGSYAYYSNKDNIFGEHIDCLLYTSRCV